MNYAGIFLHTVILHLVNHLRRYRFLSLLIFKSIWYIFTTLSTKQMIKKAVVLNS
jgi:hypothetical protein